jgi:hypothetical protein
MIRSFRFELGLLALVAAAGLLSAGCQPKAKPSSTVEAPAQPSLGADPPAAPAAPGQPAPGFETAPPPPPGK